MKEKEEMDKEVVSTFCYHLLIEMSNKPVGSLWRVVRMHGEVTIKAGKSGALREWEETEGGGFRKYPLSRSDWGRSDELKFLPIDRAHNVAFFVEVGTAEIKIYPPRYLSI
jgi:hypothetical protein